MIYEITWKTSQNFAIHYALPHSFSVNASTVMPHLVHVEKESGIKRSFNCQVISFATRFIFHISFPLTLCTFHVCLCVCVRWIQKRNKRKSFANLYKANVNGRWSRNVPRSLCDNKTLASPLPLKHISFVQNCSDFPIVFRKWTGNSSWNWIANKNRFFFLSKMK